MSSKKSTNKLWRLYKEKSSKADIISFDVFGTLLVRNCSSASTVFKLVEKQYEKKFGEKLVDFSVRRNAVEHELWSQTKDGKFTLDNIYTALHQYYGEEQCSRARDIELKIEKPLIQPNYDILPIWDDAVAHHRVIITSDMYLNSAVLEQLLKDNGLTGYSAIYISGEQKAMKADGSLFQEVEKAEGKHHFLHIGDERNGDFLRARATGWDAILTTPVTTRSRNAGTATIPYYGKPQNFADDIAFNLIAHNWKTIHGYWRRTGYYILGPLVTGFCQWLHEECIKQDIHKIIFMARDGYIIKQAYERMYPGENTSYMYISRKAALVSVFGENSIVQDILRIVKFRRTETLGSVLSRLGVDISTVPQELRDQSATRHDLYHGKYNDLIEKYIPFIRSNSAQQRKLLEQYITSLFTESRVAIVDVGWHGTMQNCIEQVIKYSNLRQVYISGFYLGLEESYSSNKIAYLDETTSFNKNVVPFIRGVIETFFTATHPSVDGYEKNSCGEIVPKYSPTTESEKTQKRIQEIQSGALLSVEKYMEFSEEVGVDEALSHAFTSSGLLNFCTKPSLYDAKHFGSIEFNDVKNRTLIAPGYFGDSDWKAGYLKAVTHISSFTGAMELANALRNKLKGEK